MELLAQTIKLVVELQLFKPQELSGGQHGVQHKANAHPADSRPLETVCVKLVEAAKVAGINLKQTFVKEGKVLNRKAGPMPTSVSSRA